jgi:hypothetical protein
LADPHTFNLSAFKCEYIGHVIVEPYQTSQNNLLIHYHIIMKPLTLVLIPIASSFYKILATLVSSLSSKTGVSNATIFQSICSRPHPYLKKARWGVIHLSCLPLNIRHALLSYWIWESWTIAVQVTKSLQITNQPLSVQTV